MKIENFGVEQEASPAILLNVSWPKGRPENFKVQKNQQRGKAISETKDRMFDVPKPFQLQLPFIATQFFKQGIEKDWYNSQLVQIRLKLSNYFHGK